MTNENVLDPVEIQMKNAISDNLDGVNQIKVIENWYDISILNATNVAIMLGIVFGMLMLITVINWSFKITKLGDKSS
jgi:hypothetical protein